MREIDYVSGPGKSDYRAERERRMAERTARVDALEQRLRSMKNAPAQLVVSTMCDIGQERAALAQEAAEAEEAKEAPMPAEEEILADSLTEEQRAQARAAIAKIADLDASVVEACNYSAAELVGVFNQATEYHNKIASGFTALENVRRQNNFRAGGSYSSSQTVYEYGVDAVKIQARLDFYNHSLTRLAQGIATRAVLQSMKGLRP